MKRAVDRKLQIAICASVIACLLSIVPRTARAEQPDFYIKPYIQLGDHSKLGEGSEDEEIVWFSQKHSGNWKVEIKTEGGEWDCSHAALKEREITDATVHPVWQYICDVHNLPPGKLFDYRVLLDGNSIFTAWSTARKGKDQPYSFALFGDTGAGSVGEKGVAFNAYNAKPDLVVIPGDIAYESGLFSEYISKFFPQLNNDSIDQRLGAPLLRSTMTVTCLGNHDIALGGGYPTNFTRYPDALAYYVIWQQPKNGPVKKVGAPDAPGLGGAESAFQPFLQSAGDAYPQENMFSFDFGDSHWLILDANLYMNWRDKEIRKWVDDDLKASHATWKFVTFHEPGFSNDNEHSHEQRMRLLCDIFQNDGVDVVLAGHAHDYQRTYPIIFKPILKHDIPAINPDGTVSGDITLDKDFDGIKDTTPKGVIYIVSGGGGAHLYPVNPVDYLFKQEADTHSFSSCIVDGKKFVFKQISENGKLLDEWTITKK